MSAAAAAITLLLILRVLQGTPAPAPTASPAQLSGVLQEAAVLDQQLPDSQKLGQWTTNMAQPLDKEMRLLFNDARGAAQMLVQNFLPESVAHSFDQPQGR